ncbi:hypothetical protein M8J76_016513 [Diaphorina citri]|nr:hypothetical protein M8J76_016513 [Diaphorina citri]
MDKQLDIITTSLEALLQRGTSPKNVGRDNAAIDAFCGLVNKEPECVPIAAKLIVSKMQSMQEWEALQALQVLEACMQHCGPQFHAEVGKFRFLNELIKLISPKYLGNLTPDAVRTEIIELLYLWTLEYPRESKIREAYEMLKKQQVVQSDPIVSGRRVTPTPPQCSGATLPPSGTLPPGSSHPASRSSSCKLASTRTTSCSILEDENQSKLLAKLLQSKKPEDLQAANKLIRTMVTEEEKKMEQRCKVMMEMESVNNNVALLTEMLDNYSGDPGDWDLIKELHTTCEGFRSNLVTLVQQLPSGDDDLFQLVISSNESLNEALAKYNSILTNMTRVQNNVPLLDMSSGRPSPQHHVPPTPSHLNDLVDLIAQESTPHEPSGSVLPNNQPSLNTSDPAPSTAPSQSNNLDLLNDLLTSSPGLLSFTTPTSSVSNQNSILSANQIAASGTCQNSLLSTNQVLASGTSAALLTTNQNPSTNQSAALLSNQNSILPNSLANTNQTSLQSSLNPALSNQTSLSSQGSFPPCAAKVTTDTAFSSLSQDAFADATNSRTATTNPPTTSVMGSSEPSTTLETSLLNPSPSSTTLSTSLINPSQSSTTVDTSLIGASQPSTTVDTSLIGASQPSTTSVTPLIDPSTFGASQMTPTLCNTSQMTPTLCNTSQMTPTLCNTSQIAPNAMHPSTPKPPTPLNSLIDTVGPPTNGFASLNTLGTYPSSEGSGSLNAGFSSQKDLLSNDLSLERDLSAKLSHLPSTNGLSAQPPLGSLMGLGSTTSNVGAMNSTAKGVSFPAPSAAGVNSQNQSSLLNTTNAPSVNSQNQTFTTSGAPSVNSQQPSFTTSALSVNSKHQSPTALNKLKALQDLDEMVGQSLNRLGLGEEAKCDMIPPSGSAVGNNGGAGDSTLLRTDGEEDEQLLLDHFVEEATEGRERGETERKEHVPEQKKPTNNLITNPSIQPSDLSCDKLSDIHINLQDIQPSGVESIKAMDTSHALTILIHLTRTRPKPNVAVFVVTTLSKLSSPMSQYLFQPVGYKLKLQPASSTSLPAFNPFLPSPAITQIMLIACPQPVAYPQPVACPTNSTQTDASACPPDKSVVCPKGGGSVVCPQGDRSVVCPQGRHAISLKFVISYEVDGESVSDMGEIPELPLSEN